MFDAYILIGKIPYFVEFLVWKYWIFVLKYKAYEQDRFQHRGQNS